MAPEPIVLRTTTCGYEVLVGRGKKAESAFDFVVKYRRPEATARPRALSHMHLVVDILQKRTGNEKLTNRMVRHILENLVDKAHAATGYPPTMLPINRRLLLEFEPLNRFGEYEVELVLAIEELIAKSEKTNYPHGTLQHDLWAKVLDGGDIYSVLSAAGWGGSYGRRW